MKRLLAILLLMLSVVTYAQQQDSCFVVSKINFVGSKVTKPSTMYREMLFREGDTICDIETIKQTRENLLNCALFNFVDFDWADDPDNTNAKTLTISVVERWYLWPVPYLAFADRNPTSWLEAHNLQHIFHR